MTSASGGILFETDTDFGHYQVVEAIYAGRPARLLYSGDKLAAQSGLALDDKPELLFDYNERFMELLRGLLPRRILLIGGGAFTLPKAINEELPDSRLTIVELDPALLPLAEQYFDFKPNKYTTVHTAEGSSFLASDTEVYDTIIIDAFSHAVVPASLQTAAFAADLKKHLRPGGVVAMNIIASYNGQRSAVLRREIAAFKPCFATLELFPAGREPSLWLTQNFILTAHSGGRELRPFMLFAPLTLPIITATNL